MPRIRLLDPDTVNKIAAGEVIERPASVVKELVENSIDAGATRILIELEDGGRSLIKVADDGCGMDPEDLSLAFQKHATSKIRDAGDLSRISTLGFRGEALASIASVSESVEVTTKTRLALTGSYMLVEAGRAGEIREVGCPAGTTIAVKGLFRNVPARRKHLRGAAHEYTRVADLIQEMAIINHGISFELYNGPRISFRSARSKSWDDAISRVMTLDIIRGMTSFEAEIRGCSIKGMAGDPRTTRAAPDMIYIYVNGRPVAARAVAAAVREAYRSIIPASRSPVAVVSLDMDPYLVDVNVHPAKREVRFLREEEISKAITSAVSEALKRGAEGRKSRVMGPAPGSGTAQVQSPLPMEAAVPGLAAQIEVEGPAQPGVRPPSLRILGQVMKLYIVAEGEDGLVIIDQHAAAERVRYERLRERYRSGRISQELLVPVTLDLSPKEQALLESWMGILDEMGFQIEAFGGSTYNVRALPALGGRLESPGAVHDILTDLFRMGRVSMDTTFKDDVLKLLACRGSVKSGSDLTLGEMKDLVDALRSCENPDTCPHGRPVVVVLAGPDLEKLFGRR